MSAKRFKKCILHIGTEKTGTKAIQHYLGMNRTGLQRHGILYPIAANADNASQWEFVAVVHKEPWNQDVGRSFGINNESDQKAFSDSLRQHLNAEFESSQNTDTLIISCEHFQSRLVSETLIQRLQDWLSPWVSEFQIVVYLRRQDRLSLSLLSTRMKSSVRFNPTNLEKVIRNPAHYYDHLGLYQKWANVFGASAITPRIYESRHWPNESLIEDFNSVCQIPNLKIQKQKLNQSLDRRGFHFLHALNHQYPIVPGDRSDPKRAALVRRVAELYSGKFYPISRTEAEAFCQEFASSNEQLRKLAFPELAGSLFDSDFSDYPETAESMEPSYSDAVDVAVTIWQDRIDQDRNTKGKLFNWLRQFGVG